MTRYCSRTPGIKSSGRGPTIAGAADHGERSRGRLENEMSKGMDRQNKESKKKPAKSLKEKRAEKAAKRSGEFTGADRIHKAVDSKH